MNALTTLATTEDLHSHLSSWRVLDCRYNAMQPQLAAQQYAQGHIEGALFVSLDSDLCAARTGRNGRHPLPERKAFAHWIGAIGIRPDDQVVCYDDSSGAIAARLWWMLRWAGHSAVCVLDGGISKWVNDGHSLTTVLPAFEPTSYPVLQQSLPTVEILEVEEMETRGHLIDARAPARYRGEQEPVDPVAGHIPGAINRFNMDNVQSDGTFKDAHTLRQEWQRVVSHQPAGSLVHYCGSGVSACHNLLALDIAGLPGGSLFVGSWSEWCSDARRPCTREDR